MLPFIATRILASYKNIPRILLQKQPMLQSIFRATLLAPGFVLMICICANSQNLTIPRDDFSIFTTDSITIEKGAVQKIDVWVLKSKLLSKKNIRMGIASVLPEGVSVNFQPESGSFDYCETTLSANPSAKAGVYYVIISSTVQNLTKGSIVKIKISESGTITKASR
jgi:hypothetical protein